MIEWQHYPQSSRPPDHLLQVVRVFEACADRIGSLESRRGTGLKSDEVLSVVSDGLQRLGFAVERGKGKGERIDVPVLLGRNGRVEQAFQADAHNPVTGTVVEIEAGRAVANNAYLKDLFEACLMQDVQYLVIAVKSVYSPANSRETRDFETVSRAFASMYASRRLELPLSGILVIGY